MSHVDSTTEPRLERILSEIRTHRKRVAALAGHRRPARRLDAGLSPRRDAPRFILTTHEVVEMKVDRGLVG